MMEEEEKMREREMKKRVKMYDARDERRGVRK